MGLPSRDANRKFFVHPNALCDSTQVGEGTRLWAFSHVMAGATIGRDCNLGEHVFVENKVVIGDGCTIKNGVAIWDLVYLEDQVFVGPYVVFTNERRPRSFIKRGADQFLPTKLRRGSTIGANATLVCGITVGEFALVGAGAVVTSDVPPHALVVGTPARVVGKVCFCGETLGKKDLCKKCGCSLSENSWEKAAKRWSTR